MRLAVDVAGEVLGRPAELEQLLLEVAALGGMHDDACRRRRRAPSSGLILLVLRSTSSSTGRSVSLQDQAVFGVLLEPEPAVAVHRVGHVDEQGVRHGVRGCT